MENLSDEEKAAVEVPTPKNFDVYLPWACAQLRIDTQLVVTRVLSLEKLNQGIGKINKGKSKHTKSMHEVPDTDSIKTLDGLLLLPQNSEETVIICATYDVSGNLLQLKFDKNKKIPRQILKLIGLIINYHKFMTRIVINKGLNNECLYEIKKLLVLANITDVCLDNTALCDGHYDLLLEDSNKLKHLSMSRCNIDDDMVNRIATNLSYPLAASKTLSALNLTSNRITDAGAKYLAVALRTNRQLVYLNLADNTITDVGAGEIFDSLADFCLKNEEVASFRYRHVQYSKDKNSLINEIANELKCADFDRKIAKGRSVKPTIIPHRVPSKKGNEKDLFRIAGARSFTDLDLFWIEKARIKVEERMIPFVDPFSTNCVYRKDGETYCYGNNSLAYINISYNNISYLTVKNILTVLLKQQSLNRTPKGLVNVILEGNFIPSRCRELEQINCILLSNITTATAVKSTHSKR